MRDTYGKKNEGTTTMRGGITNTCATAESSVCRTRLAIESVNLGESCGGPQQNLNPCGRLSCVSLRGQSPGLEDSTDFVRLVPLDRMHMRASVVYVPSLWGKHLGQSGNTK